MAATRKNVKKNEMFSRKIPQNPRYKHIKSTLDTGASITNYMGKLEEMRKNYRFRKDEIFKRMKVSTFAQLVLQVAEVVNMELDRQQLESARTDLEPDVDTDNSDLEQSQNGNLTDRSLLSHVITGIGEVDLQEQNNNLTKKESEAVEDEKLSNFTPAPTSLPYLLLDVRDKDEFNKCHIIGAINYPVPMLTRSVNYLIKEMLEFKNKPGKIIIVYDDDEKLAPNVATVLVQRELENVIMLSGGMKVLHKKFPGCFMSGTLPTTCFSPVLDRKGKPKPPPVITENYNKDWFDPDLLERINEHLEEVLLGNETSRMSSRSTTSRSSKQSGRLSTASTVKSSSSQASRR